MRPARPLSRQDLQLILEHTAPLWQEIRGRRIFITGGTGFLGSWLVESFCHINHTLALDAAVVVLTRNPIAFQTKCPHLASDRHVMLYQGDVINFTFPKGEFDCVVHAAAETYARNPTDKALNLFSSIVAGAERVLQFASACNTRKFLFISSGAIYGKQPPEVTHLPESFTGAPDTLDPMSTYGEAKRAAELLCALYHTKHAMECKVARCWTFCGPHLALDQHFAIGNFIADVLAGRPIQIRGDGTPRRSYLYAADLAVWLWTMLFRGPGLVPFNVGSANDVSILELARIVAKTLNPRADIHVAQQSMPGVPTDRYVPSVDRARELLALEETVSLEEGIRRTADWYALLKRPNFSRAGG